MPKITKRVVDALKPDPEREVFAWDSELRGFGVRVMPLSAQKAAAGAAVVGTYFIQYRSAEGRTRRLAIGRVGTLTPDEARDLGREKLGEVAKGADPSAERHKLRSAMTVSELCDLYLEEAAAHVKASTLAMDKSRINVHVKPLLGRHSVASLTTDDIERMQSSIAAGKTARPPARDENGKRKGRGGIASGGAGVAARTVGMLGTILELGRRRKLIKENPARGVQKLREGRQRRFLQLEEIAELGKTMREAELAGDNAAALAAIRFLLMTGLRRMEALALPRKWVDGRARCIRFEDTKSGAQLRPIGSDAVKLIEAQPKRDDCPWVFPAAHGEGHLVGVPKILAGLCAKAELEGVTVHVLRHSFAAAAADLGYSELTIAGLLGHSVPGITARYAHIPDAALVAAADRVAARIRAALDGETTTAEVVPFQKQAAAL